MSPELPHRRRWFQFSLRALLGMMLIVGVATAVYRWPWEVSKEEEFETLAFGSYYFSDARPTGDIGTLVTTYHRDWRGKPVKHGPERFYVQEVLVQEKLYGEGVLHGLARCFNDKGEVLEERTYNDGIQHGPCRIGDGKTWVVSGHYYHYLKDGAWRVLENRQQGTPEGWFVVLNGDFRFSTRPRYHLDVPTDPIVVHEEWRYGKRHGKWEWRTMAGELINSAHYENDRLTVWNAEDVPKDYWYWLADRDFKLFERLKQPAAGLVPDPPSYSIRREGEYDRGGDLSLFEPPWSRQTVLPTTDFRAVHFALPLTTRPFRWPQASIGDNLLEYALLQGLAVDFRYGGLWFVPADEVTGCHDATGVQRVKFSAGSTQAREWEELVTMEGISLSKSKEGIVFGEAPALNFVSSIHFDYSELDGHLLPLRQSFYVTHPCERKLRDAVGLALYRAGLQCEQRGDTLVIKPHWTQRSTER